MGRKDVMEACFFVQAHFPALNRRSRIGEYTEQPRGLPVRARVAGILPLRDREYWQFANNLLVYRDYLHEFGGTDCDGPCEGKDWKEMTEEDKKYFRSNFYFKTLMVLNKHTGACFLINSEGYDYARYVGLPM